MNRVTAMPSSNDFTPTSQNIKKLSADINKPLILVGMMGVGKTKIGKLLAQRLNYTFFDADSEIQKAAGCSISDIFEYYGEESFRDVERKVMLRLMEENQNAVIATGGGSFINEQIRQAVLDGGIAIWLDCPPDVIYERIASHTHRPLLQNDNPLQTLIDLLDIRRPFYAQSPIHVAIKGQDMDDTLNMVLANLIEYMSS